MPDNEEDKRLVKVPPVPSDDKSKSEKEEFEEGKKKREDAEDTLARKKPVADEEDDLSPQDKKLKEDLELMVSRVIEPAAGADSEGVQKLALETMRTEIRSSTSSMTAIPKPLKFLRAFFTPLKEFYVKAPVSANKRLLADILSVLSMTITADAKGDCLAFRLEGSDEKLGSWGHQYVAFLSGEIGVEYQKREEDEKPVDDLVTMVDEIIRFNCEHNAEFDAVDLLIDVDLVDKMIPYINKDNVSRVCRYIIACSDYQSDMEDKRKMLNIAHRGYMQCELYPSALVVAIKAGDRELMNLCFTECQDEAILKQLAYICGQQKVLLTEQEDNYDIYPLIGNNTLSECFLSLAKEMDVLEPKAPEDVFKSHLEEGKNSRRARDPTKPTEPTVDSAKQVLAATIANAFVNCAFGRDTLITPDNSEWLHKNKGHGMLSAAASIGMLMLWDVESGYSVADRYSHSKEVNIKAGSLLANGILSSGVTSEMDAAFALLSEHLDDKNKEMKVAAVLGLGLAYAGTQREEMKEVLIPLIVDSEVHMEVCSLACLSLGYVFVGSADEDTASAMIDAFMDRTETDLNDSTAKMMCLGMGLLFLGCGEVSETLMSLIQAIPHPIKKYLDVTLRTCAMMGTSNMLEIQNLTRLCSERLYTEGDDGEDAPAEEKKEEKSAADSSVDEEPKVRGPLKFMHQAVAVLGMGMVALGEDIATTMALRTVDHILQYGDLNIRRAIPAALSLLSLSNPQLSVMDSMAKLSHDQDEQVSQNAILALGFLGAGTNNSRIAQYLRQLATYYEKEPNHLFLVRIAQGLLHMGKGLLTLSPKSQDGLITNKVAMTGILTVLHLCLDLKNTVLKDRHYLLFTLVTAIRPRMIMTVDEEGNKVNVGVRVGAAVDTVGQPGKPRTITGFQTHDTPVLLSHGERAELASDDYTALPSILEGIVVLRKVPAKDE